MIPTIGILLWIVFNLKILKNGYLVTIKKGSHMAILESPELINSLIGMFLNDNLE